MIMILKIADINIHKIVGITIYFYVFMLITISAAMFKSIDDLKEGLREINAFICATS